jgi:uncharacterized protein (TIGR00290 family)
MQETRDAVHTQRRSNAGGSRPKALVSWSSGKDSAWALHILRRQAEYDVVGLVTTVNEQAGRVAMHAVRTDLLARQAAAAGAPLWSVGIPHPCSNEQYEAAMTTVIRRAQREGIEAFAFGDLYLQDVRRYRETRLEGSGIRPIFPLWLQPTDALAREMLAAGVRATLTCVDPRKLDRRFAGRELTAELLRELPPDVDPCGENGEFHTFVHDGPMLLQAIDVAVGEVVEREGFVFADLTVQS